MHEDLIGHNLFICLEVKTIKKALLCVGNSVLGLQEALFVSHNPFGKHKKKNPHL